MLLLQPEELHLAGRGQYLRIGLIGKTGPRAINCGGGLERPRAGPGKLIAAADFLNA